ncbi:60S ribosomal protein L7/L12 precursor-like protein [Leptotrombidium deliense]|uniref:60S ribosomal protein L7/L12-like protein n=1 Tax=Leptotrombidium deliense TaxID=299467 RepID=A0A443SKG7_9ACAR|nr:60S ribosomal protein L7/L12 precursor-like protein [Leptotrombidium deliense]
MHAFINSVKFAKNLSVILSGQCFRNGCLFRRQMTASAEQVLKTPQPSTETKEYPEKLHNIVEQISGLTLLEVSELNKLLKLTLNIPDAPMMQMASLPMSTAKVEAKEAEAPAAVKTDYTLKLVKFDETKKVALIKHVKTLLEGMNLVQAKKFVETLPQIIKTNLTKDEAEKLKKGLEEFGGSCTME